MKKLMTVIASLASAVFAAGAVYGALTSTGFEDSPYVADQDLDTTLDDAGNDETSGDFARTWVDVSSEIEEGAAVVTAYDTKPTITGVAAADLGDNYLKLETGSVEVQRYAQAGGSAMSIGDGLYIDTVVQFTAAEEAPATSTGDKLCVWLKNNEEDPDACTLMVTAGYVEDDVGSSIIVSNYVTTTTLATNSWHRLQVKALSDIATVGGDAALNNGFVILVDGVVVATEDCPINSEYLSEYEFSARAAKYISELSYSLFPSLVAYGAAGDGTITSLAFKGSGSVDNISFTNAADIDPISTVIPTAISGLTEDGTEQYGVENLDGMGVAYLLDSGDLVGTNAGDYSAEFALNVGYAWSDGSITNKTVYWSIASGGGSSEPSIVDGDSEDVQATVDTNTKTITIDPASTATSITVSDAEGYKITVPVTVNSVTGIADADISVAYGGTDITGAFTISSGAIALNPVGSVTISEETIPVVPTLTDSSDATKPFTVGDNVSVGVKAIPGLTYTLKRGTTLGTYGTNVDSTKATTTRVSLTDSSQEKPNTAFYVIDVTK